MFWNVTFGYILLKNNKATTTILTVQSSEHEATTSSLKGFHFISRMGPRWPVTRKALKSNLPVYKKTKVGLELISKIKKCYTHAGWE